VKGNLISVAQQFLQRRDDDRALPYVLTVTMNYGTAIVRSVTGATFVDVRGLQVFRRRLDLGQHRQAG